MERRLLVKGCMVQMSSVALFGSGDKKTRSVSGFVPSGGHVERKDSMAGAYW